jgi:hypothetical protein
MINDSTPTKSVDVVGVFDVDFNQVFPGARPLKLVVNDKATFFKHPLEDSSIRIDHMIFDPVEAVLSLMIYGHNYRNVYQQVKQKYRNQTQLIVLTKVDTYQNMYIQAMPHDESPENFDSVIMALKLYETKFGVTAISFASADPSDSDTKNRGQQDPKEPTENQVGTLLRLTNWIGGLFK